MNLTPRQIQVLRWFDENPSTMSRWTVNGRDIKPRDKPDTWTHMEISGAQGSILVAFADLQAIGPFRTLTPSSDKMYGVNERGREAIAAALKPEVQP